MLSKKKVTKHGKKLDFELLTVMITIKKVMYYIYIYSKWYNFFIKYFHVNKLLWVQ